MARGRPLPGTIFVEGINRTISASVEWGDFYRFSLLAPFNCFNCRYRGGKGDGSSNAGKDGTDVEGGGWQLAA